MKPLTYAKTMFKCIYCKKHSKDQYRCEITGAIRNEPCVEYKHWYWRKWFKTTVCKHFKINMFARFKKWLINR